jgi:hypothetical protein
VAKGTEVKPNSRRTQEQADISSIEKSDANPIMMLQAQVPSNNRVNPDNDIKTSQHAMAAMSPVKTTTIAATATSHMTPEASATVATANSYMNQAGTDSTKDCSTRDDGDDSSNNVAHTTRTIDNYNPMRTMTAAVTWPASPTPSTVTTLIATRPSSRPPTPMPSLPSISCKQTYPSQPTTFLPFFMDSKCTDAAQRSSPLQRLAHPLVFGHTRARASDVTRTSPPAGPVFRQKQHQHHHF